MRLVGGHLLGPEKLNGILSQQILNQIMGNNCTLSLFVGQKKKKCSSSILFIMYFFISSL